MLLVLLQLKREDHQWWWPSLLVPGSSGLYLAVYTAHFFFFRLQLSEPDVITSTVVYFAYMSSFAFLFGLVNAAVGYHASLRFVRWLYSFGF